MNIRFELDLVQEEVCRVRRVGRDFRMMNVRARWTSIRTELVTSLAVAPHPAAEHIIQIGLLRTIRRKFPVLVRTACIQRIEPCKERGITKESASNDCESL